MNIKPNLESGHMGHESEWEPPRWVKLVIFLTIIAAMLLVARCDVRAAETNAPAVIDLGVITTDTLIELKACARRSDFAMFKVEVLPRNRRGWTNKVEFTTTNNFLRIDDLAAVPEGNAIMGVRSYCANGDASPITLFKLNMQRGLPDPPKVEISHVLRNKTEQKIEHVIDAIQNAPAPDPPTPPGMIQTNKSAVPTRSAVPLPGGTNETYSQYQARLEDAVNWGRRRNQ